MELGSESLAGIRVQTARMVEIYALLRRELEQMPAASFRAEDVAKLHRAIGSVQASMRELQEHVVKAREGSSVDSAEARELEEILNSVLEWVQEERD